MTRGIRIHVAPKEPESEVLAQCLAWLSLQHGVLVWRSNSGAFVGEYKGKKRFVKFGRTGQADISGIMAPNGRRIEIECKATGKKLNMKPGEDHQFQFLTEISRHGGIAFVCDSLEECIIQWKLQLPTPSLRITSDL